MLFDQQQLGFFPRNIDLVEWTYGGVYKLIVVVKYLCSVNEYNMDFEEEKAREGRQGDSITFS